jgi:KDO2-lipid IV(A) lauroyltransferase
MKWKHVRRRLREPLVAMVLRLLCLTIGLLSRRFLPRAAEPLGRVLFSWPPARRLVLANLAVAFPDLSSEEARTLARRNCSQLALTLLEFFWFIRHPDRLLAEVDGADPGLQVLLQVRDAGKAVVLLTPHLGNWELAGQLASAHGLRLSAVAARIRSVALDRLLWRARGSHGMAVIAEKGGAKGMLAAIRRGRSIALLIDQNTKPESGGVFIPFFGLPAATSPAPAYLARRLGLDVRVMAMVRENGRLCFRTETLPRPVAAYADEVSLTTDLLAAHERLIRRYPEQYVWLYERWATVPGDADSATRQRFPYYASAAKPATPVT